MPNIEFIYDRDCPNVVSARDNLRTALMAAGMPQEWQQWDRADPASPDHASYYGSPTILVDGRDIAGQAPSPGADSCRIYTLPEGGMSGVPAVEIISAALGKTSSGRFQWGGILAALPGFGASLLPVGLCPACWPAYAGFLGSLGIAPILKTTYLLPLTGVFFGIALFGLAYRAQTRRGYRPLALGVLGVGVAMVGKFAVQENSVMYPGLALLLAASIWNSWPRPKTVVSGSCASCAPQELKAIN